jgi:hypothetical protein
LNYFLNAAAFATSVEICEENTLKVRKRRKKRERERRKKEGQGGNNQWGP